jgi:uncharacterized protein YdaU (DUF1376 family)
VARAAFHARATNMSEKRPTLPWIPFYYRDFLASTMGWSTTERGAYLLLLFAQWEAGPIDSDPVVLASIAGVTPEEMRQMWKRIGRKFRDTPEGLINERCDGERERAVQTHANRQRGAAKSRAKKRSSNVVPFGGNSGR